MVPVFITDLISRAGTQTDSDCALLIPNDCVPNKEAGENKEIDNAHNMYYNSRARRRILWIRI